MKIALAFKPRFTDPRFVAWLQNRRNRRSSAFLLRDDFNSGTLASPRACIPGPGSLTITDPDAILVLANGRFRYNGANPTGPTGLHTGILPRKAGRAFLFSCWNRNSGFVRCGFTSGAVPSENAVANIIPSSNTILIRVPSGNTTIYSYTLASATSEVQLAFVQRGTGCFWLIREGGPEKPFEIAWIDNSNNSNLAGYIGRGTSASGSDTAFDQLKLVDLGSPFETDYGLAAYRSAVPSNNITASGLSDGWTEFTWTPAASETLELSFRRNTDSNCWVVRCEQAADTIKLIEINGGVETERATNVQTWTAGVAVRLVVQHYGTQIRVFAANVSKLTATSASFQFETGIKASGFTTAADLVVWPSKVTLPTY